MFYEYLILVFIWQPRLLIDHIFFSLPAPTLMAMFYSYEAVRLNRQYLVAIRPQMIEQCARLV